MEEVKIINRFRKPFAFPSNMAKCDIFLEDGHLNFDSVEAAYQYARCRDEKDRERILRYQKNPALVKRVSHSMAPREDWDEVKLGVMRQLLVQKFSVPKFRDKLVALWNCERIEEGNLHRIYGGASI